MDASTIVLFVILFLLLLSTTPIAVALGLTALFYVFYFTTLPLTQLSDTLFNALNSFPLMAIPLFILAATIMTHGGISQRLIAAANALVGYLPGGLGITAVTSCIFFAAISGSSPATVVAVGTILIPGMIRAGYGREFSTGLIASSGGLGALIPPSIVLIVYGIVTETSIGDLFIAGIIPGILTGVLLIVMVVVVSLRRGFGAEVVPMNIAERVRDIRDAFLGILLPVLVLGGIYGGIFTPTEAAAIAVFYAFIVSMFVYREINFRNLAELVVRSGPVVSYGLVHHRKRHSFHLRSDLRTHPERDSEFRYWVRSLRVGLPSCDQRFVPCRRLLHRSYRSYSDFRTYPISGSHGTRCSSGPLWSHHGHEPRDRYGHPTARTQSLRR